MLSGIPVYPGAQSGALESSGYSENEILDMTAGYGTTRSDRLPQGATIGEAYDWYIAEFEKHGWEVGQRGGDAWFEAKKSDAYAEVMFGQGAVDVEVDHNCYKGDAAPHCFGP